MAKKVNKTSLGDVLRTSAIVWYGESNIPQTNILVVDFNNTKHVALVELNESTKTFTLKAPKDTLSLRTELVNILYEIHPFLKAESYNFVSDSIRLLPQNLSVVKDFNAELLSLGIKPLKEVTIRMFLDNEGLNLTKYEYSKVKVDNSHKLKGKDILKGYANYPKEAIEHMTDVEAFKGMEPTYPELDALILQGANFILAGPAGTGKTTEFKIVGANEEIPVYVLSFTANSQEDDFISSFIPNTGTEGGNFLLKRSVFTYAFEHGGIVILDEINYAHPNVLSAFHSALDDTAVIVLDDGTVIKRSPNFRCVATMNPNYAGTNKLNAAFLDRFDHFEWPRLSRKELIRRLEFNTGYKNNKALSVIADIFEKVSDVFHNNNYETEVTYRRAESFLTKMLLNPNMSLEFIFDVSFLNITALTDLDDIPTELSDLRKICYEYLQDLRNVLSVDDGEYVEGTYVVEKSLEFEDLDLVTDLEEAEFI